jgi:hypothetical protein
MLAELCPVLNASHLSWVPSFLPIVLSHLPRTALSVGIFPQYMDATPHLGTVPDLEMRTARVADPALGTHFGMFYSTGQHPQHWFSRFDA